MTAFSIESFDLLFEETDAQWFRDNQAAAKIIDVGSIKIDLSIKIFISCLGRAINTRVLRTEYQKDDCISHSIGFDNWQITQSFFFIIDRSRKHIPSVACRRFVMLRIKLFSRFWNPGCAGVDFPAKPESENCRKSFPRFLSYQELWSTRVFKRL